MGNYPAGMLKRSFDFVLSSVAVTVLAPVLLAIAGCILLFDGWPIFYRGIRAGRYGKSFRIFKFRTMVIGAEGFGGSATADTDRRITAFGRFLRRHKLDELPQLMNVLLGQMSMVGPRPEIPEYVELLSEAEKPILSVRPGITDWATLWDRDEGALLALSSQPERMYLQFIRPHKVTLQLEYVRRQSFWIDLLILCKTAHAVIFNPVPPSFDELHKCKPRLMQAAIMDAEAGVLQNEADAAPK